MLILEYSTQFKKDFKKITKMPIPDIIEVGDIISTLQKGLELKAKHVDHPLSGNWNGFRDCHIKPDLVLIYRIHENTLQLTHMLICSKECQSLSFVIVRFDAARVKFRQYN